MTIKLNPCEMCGADPRRSEESFCNGKTYTVYCPVCDNEILDAKYSQDAADAEWNAENPKEEAK
jgi:hypothetical protein